ncbi:MAG: single-stranded DNA-binding protein [Burkholderiaceae bacterium]|jgi:single-stranded DNA-binding protein|nr:single-stranded DNA-binding protein [Burkholderiaceae bacterium]MCO5104257.1 single-stranded DNA-binding protein [Burkholderiaceae bacterium]
MIDGLVAGRLHGAPGERIDKAGNAFVVAKVLAAACDGENLFVNVIAFSKQTCTALLALREGDSLALTGSLTPRVWTDKQGNARPSLDMVANAVLAAHDAHEMRPEPFS